MINLNIKNFAYAGFGGNFFITNHSTIRIKQKFYIKINRSLKMSYYNYLPKLIKREAYLSLFNGNGLNCITVVPKSAQGMEYFRL